MPEWLAQTSSAWWAVNLSGAVNKPLYTSVVKDAAVSQGQVRAFTCRATVFHTLVRVPDHFTQARAPVSKTVNYFQFLRLKHAAIFGPARRGSKVVLDFILGHQVAKVRRAASRHRNLAAAFAAYLRVCRPPAALVQFVCMLAGVAGYVVDCAHTVLLSTAL